MSSAFLERFKDKRSLVSRNGEFDFTSARPANAGRARVASAAPQKRLLESPKADAQHFPQSVLAKQARGKQTPVRETSVDRRQVRSQASRDVDFHPYTLQEYSTLKEQPLVLGGLGPSQVGSAEWEKRKAMHERKQDYARLIQLKNRQLPRAPPRTAQEPSRPSARERAMEFAKRLPKPVAKASPLPTEQTESLQPMTDLEELEAKHAACRKAVEEMKAQLRT